MKYMVVVLLMWPAMVLAKDCPKGSFDWHGECTWDLQPEIAKPVQPSDEKPPSDKMPSYQRDDVKIVDAPSMTAEDAKADLEKTEAEKEGKQKAGIKPNKVAR